MLVSEVEDDVEKEYVMEGAGARNEIKNVLKGQTNAKALY